MDNAENLFNPSLAAALMKLDPEDGEQIMEYLKTHALLTREKAMLQASVREQKKLLVENGKLKKDIEQLRIQLQEKQKRRTVKALVSLAPPPPTVGSAPSTSVDPPAGATAAVTKLPPPSSSSCEQRHGGSRRSRGGRKAPSETTPLDPTPRVDVSRLDLRVGRILLGRRHPLGSSVSVLEVDVGEETPRTVVCRLEKPTTEEVAHSPDLVSKDPIEVYDVSLHCLHPSLSLFSCDVPWFRLQLQGSLAVLLCNARPWKLRGVVSQARLLCCASSDQCMEVLAPPSASTPGDRVTFLSYPGRPDRELQAKQRLWERLQPDLQVDSRGVATYKGCRFEVRGKGLCRAPSLTNCSITQT